MAEESKQEQERSIILEIVAEDEHDVDPASIGEVGRGIRDEVKGGGYVVESVYRGLRGGPDVLLEIFNAAQSTGQVIWADIYAQRDAIGVVNNLFGIFGGVSSVVMLIFNARKKHEAKQAVVAQEQHPVKISIVIDGEPITVEADNFKDAQAMLELAKKFHSTHPNVKATPQSQVKIQASVPKKVQRKRR